MRDSWYYLFFCTQRHAFHGLVQRNPSTAPDQAYAWLVLPDLRVVSFANYLCGAGVDLRSAGAAQARAGFGGTPVPTLTLTLDGTSTAITPA